MLFHDWVALEKGLLTVERGQNSFKHQFLIHTGIHSHKRHVITWLTHKHKANNSVHCLMGQPIPPLRDFRLSSRFT